MPKFKGSCGCYNRQDARDLGLAPAIVWNDLMDRAEHFDINPIWYDQKDAAERLGMDRSMVNRAIVKLSEVGRIKKKAGYRPNSNTRTTWIEIIEEARFLKAANRDFRNHQNEISIINDTNINNTNTASQPKVAPQTSRKKSEFNLLIEKLCEILSLDVTKLNWSAVGKWHKVGKASNCTNEDFIKAAEAMRDAAKSNGFTVSLQKVLTNTEYWLRQAEDKKPKRGMIIT